MKLIKIGNTVINLEQIAYVHLEAPKPNYFPLMSEPREAPIGVQVSFTVSQGSLGYIDAGCGQTDPAYIWFSGNEAAALREYIEKNCFVALA